MACRSVKKRGFGAQLKLAIQDLQRSLNQKVKNAFVDDEPPAAKARKNGGPPTIKAMLELYDRYSLAQLLPYESFDDETQLFYNTDTVGFVLLGMPATGLSEGDLNVLNGLFSMQHKPNTSIQISLYGNPNIEPQLQRWSEYCSLPEGHPFKPVIAMLAKNRVDYLKTGKWASLQSGESIVLRKLQLMVSYTIQVPEGMTPLDLAQDDVEQLQRTRASFIAMLKSTGIPTQALDATGFIRVMSGILNPSHQAQPVLEYDEHQLLNEQCVDADTMAMWGSGASSLVHQDQAFSILPFHVRQFPRQWQGQRNKELLGSFTNSILRLGSPFLLTMAVNVPDQVSEKSYVSQKKLRATQMSSSQISKYVPQWAERKQDWDFAERNIDAGDKMLESFFQIIILCPEGSEERNEQALKSIYDNFGWILSRSRYTPVHSFLGALPMGLCVDTQKALKFFGHYKKQLSSSCTKSAPWIGESVGTKTPLLLLFGRLGQISYFDNFDNTQGNMNLSCCATSGSGKSVLAQELVQRILADHGLVFIIDAGHSYRNINALLGGTYIDFGDHVPKLNPFSTIRSDDPKCIKEQLPLLKLLFEQMASPATKLDQAYRSTLEMAIMGAWHDKKETACVDDVITHLKHNVDDQGIVTPEAQFLHKALYSYSSLGVYGDHFNGQSNIDLNNNFVVLELDALNSTPDLQSVVLLILMMRITQAMYLSGNRTQRKMCIIDEAWRLLGSGNAGDFIAEGYRVARKHGGCFMTITQKISDYFQSETAKAAYMNSDFSIFLRQKPDALVEAEKAGYMDNSDGRIQLLNTLRTERGRYSELAINSPTGWSVHRLYIDPFAAKLFSTTAEDVDTIMNFKRQGVPIHKAIERMLEV